MKTYFTPIIAINTTNTIWKSGLQQVNVVNAEYVLLGPDFGDAPM